MATRSSSSSAATPSSSGPEVTDLTMQHLEIITNEFSAENRVGRGSYGVVYRGRYGGYEIAVKKLFVINENDDEAFTNEFQQLKKVRHENIIRLIAYCHDTRYKPIEIYGQKILSSVIDRALCFEYMPQGSLADHISDESCIHDWATTYKIIRGTCEGLHYLHEGRGEGDYIYHLDLKPDNILLDKDMTPKIADFGLSRLFGESKTYQTSSHWQGTLGFMPPEYINNGTISPKNDVFSLGVIIFYLVAGRIGYGDFCDSRSSCENFTEKVQEYWKKKRRATVSHYICEEIDLLGVKICIELAMTCVETDRAKRPSTEAIIDELQKLDVQIKKMSLIGEAAHLLLMLRAQGDGERGGNQAWDQLRGKLVQVATYVANPRITVDALLELLEDARNLRLGHQQAETLLKRIMASLEEETVRALDAGMAIHRLRELLLVVADQLDMVPLCDSEPVQMVDHESNFCEANVADFVKCSAQLSAPNAPYAVISIVGSQTSGKSYLLNRLFGTKFPELDLLRGRFQTSRGIMMSRCIGPSLLVLDFEGFYEREEGQDWLCEGHASLFALTISDVILVTMSGFDIGRQKAGSILIFKKLFKERNKLEAGLTKILVVVRFYDGETPFEILREVLMRTLEKMWKSANGTSMRLKDYFQINVVGLPDKNSESFQTEVTTLRKHLSKINTDHNRSSKVPASSFAVSSKLLWDAISKNKKPSSKVPLGIGKSGYRPVTKFPEHLRERWLPVKQSRDF